MTNKSQKNTAARGFVESEECIVFRRQQNGGKIMVSDLHGVEHDLQFQSQASSGEGGQ